MFPITIFASEPTKGKVPISPFGDKTFNFVTLELETLEQTMRQLSQNFVLNLALDLKIPLRRRRTKENIQQYLYNKLTYFIIDIDDVSSIAAMRHIIEYFKNYRCVICESRSFNGIDNFNLKGVVQCNLNIDQLKLILDQIFFELADFGTVDRSVGRCPTFNAPINKFKVLLDASMTGKVLEFNDFDITASKNAAAPLDLKFSGISIDGAKNIADICLSVFQQQGFKAIGKADNGGIRFEHPSEKKSPGGYIWFESYPYVMRHFNSTRNVNIANFVKQLPEYKEIERQNSVFNTMFFTPQKYTKEIVVNTRYLEVTSEIEQAIKNFIDSRDGLFAVHSAMGTGKSSIIRQIIIEANNAEQSVLLVTPRISVALDFKQKYNLKMYGADAYEVGDSLVCQYDSLHHYNLRCFDIVIYDEFCSTVVHSRTGINNNDERLFSIFMSSLKKKTVIADAFINGFDALLKKTTKDTFIIRNEYRDKIDVTSYDNLNTFKSAICRQSQFSKISVSTTSMAFGKACATVLSDLGCRVCTIFGDTPEKAKNKIYEWVRDPLDNHFDALVFTPTVTVGISIEVPIESHFHYDCGHSCDIVSSLQMIKRVRKAHSIHYYVQNANFYRICDPDQITANWLANMSDKDKLASWIFTCNDYGELNVSKKGKFAAQIDSRINCLSAHRRESFEGLLTYQFAGVPMRDRSFVDNNHFKKYETANLAARKEMEQALARQYLAMNDLDKLCIHDTNLDKIVEIDASIKPVDVTIKEKIFKCALKDVNFLQKCTLYKLAACADTNVITEVMAYSIARNDIELFNFLSDLKTLGKVKDHYRTDNLESSLRRICTKLGYKKLHNGDGTFSYSVTKEVKDFAEYIIPKWTLHK